jgi:subtilisin family serine protease
MLAGSKPRRAVTPPAEVNYKSLQKFPLNIRSSMDARLQLTLVQARTGTPRMASASTSANEIPVMAKVNDLAAWESLSEVRPGAMLGKTEDGNVLVTGRIPVSRIEAVRQHSSVVSLKAAHSLRPSLEATTREVGCRAKLLPAGTDPLGGKGVVVGIVDFGCDFAHENFRNADGSSRILAIWNQNDNPQPNSPHGYGRLYAKQEIDAALKKDDPYAALGYAPPRDLPSGPPGCHGTHVMDITAGNGRGSGTPGCAPEADIVFVELGAGDIPWEGPEAVGTSFGDSVHLLEALDFIFGFAGDRPCVVNLSLGTNGGPHDGTTLTEQGMDLLMTSAPNRAVVIAASNSYADSIHAQGEVPVNGSSDLQWELPNNSFGQEMEIWFPGQAQLALELIAPDGMALGLVEPGSNLSLSSNNQIVVFVANRLDEPNNHDNCLGVFLGPGLPVGRWTVRLHCRSNGPVHFHAWIERLDAAQSAFAPPQDNRLTLGSISCGKNSIVAGSYDAHKSVLPISYFSSSGPTRDGREKPELSAPGHDVVAAWSRTRTGVLRKSGTSMAAPAVTGLIALLFAEARRRNQSLTIAQTRDLLRRSARQNPPAKNAGEWDERYGYGRASAEALGLLAPLAPPAADTLATAIPSRKRRQRQSGF